MKQKEELSRRIYWISAFLAVFTVSFLVSVIFLNPSSVGNENFLWFFNLWAFIWAVIFIVVLLLFFVLARNLIKLFFEFQAKHPGSRIKSKLVLTLVIFSLFPSVIMFFVAFGLINQNLTKWVSAPSEQLLDSSQVIAEEFYRLKKAEAMANGARLASILLSEEDFNQIGPQLRSYGFDAATLLTPQGEKLLSIGTIDTEAITPEVISAINNKEVYYRLATGVNAGFAIIDQGFVGVPSQSPLLNGSILLLSFTLPESVSFHTDKVMEANEVYKNLKGTLASLRIYYFSILALTTLAVVFGFVWLGSYIARRLTGPLEALAEGSRALASGNLAHQVDVHAVDELKILVDSFNLMAKQLKESRDQLQEANQRLTKTNVRLDERRRYIETILQNIATGVLTVDDTEVILTVNEAALKMLQTSRGEIVGQKMKAVTDPGLYSEFSEMKKRALLYGTSRRQVTIQANERQLDVAATMTTSPVSALDSAVFLIVLDDLTELIRSEKFAAWREVARRLAHEIKNPLTPIQLSAERIKKRFDKIASTLPETNEIREFREVLLDASRIIVAESHMLKTLLNEFSSFSRLPICNPRRVRLHDLIEKTLGLYDGRMGTLKVEKAFDTRIGTVTADPDQMQRVFINLLDNSMDALVETEGERKISITTDLNQSRSAVTIQFLDTGHGIAAEDYEHLFLPYFSTKRKGTGLGLAIVRQIVSEHNGFVRAEPNWPKGTRVVLEIPVK